MISLRDVVLVVLVVLAVSFSYRIGRARGMVIERNRTPEPITPTCPCEHVWGEHKKGGECQVAIRRPHYDSIGSRNGHEWVQCACTVYHGPEMLTKEYFNPGTFTS